jgi:hypothetical protein
MKSALKVGLLITISALALAACGSGGPKESAGTTTTLPKTVRLLNYSGLNQNVAEISLNADNLYLINVTTKCSNLTPQNDVISQSPAMGSVVNRSVVVDLVVSSGSCAPPCPYVYADEDGATLCSVSPVLTDPTLLVQALNTAAQNLMGEYPPSDQIDEFVNQFQSDQKQQERDGAIGKAWYNLDPVSEANAFINANDQADVEAYGAAQLGNDLNCILSGSPNC